jgi:hypothetical protein
MKSKDELEQRKIFQQTTNFSAKLLVYDFKVLAKEGKGEGYLRLLSRAIKDNNLKAQQ